MRIGAADVVAGSFSVVDWGNRVERVAGGTVLNVVAEHMQVVVGSDSRGRIEFGSVERIKRNVVDTCVLRLPASS